MACTMVAGDIDQGVKAFALPQRLYYFGMQSFAGGINDCDGALPLNAAVKHELMRWRDACVQCAGVCAMCKCVCNVQMHLLCVLCDGGGENFFRSTSDKRCVLQPCTRMLHHERGEITRGGHTHTPLASAFACASFTALCTISTPTTCAQFFAIDRPRDPVPQQTSNRTVFSSGLTHSCSLCSSSSNATVLTWKKAEWLMRKRMPPRES